MTIFLAAEVSFLPIKSITAECLSPKQRANPLPLIVASVRRSRVKFIGAVFEVRTGRFVSFLLAFRSCNTSPRLRPLPPGALIALAALRAFVALRAFTALCAFVAFRALLATHRGAARPNPSPDPSIPNFFIFLLAPVVIPAVEGVAVVVVVVSADGLVVRRCLEGRVLAVADVRATVPPASAHAAAGPANDRPVDECLDVLLADPLQARHAAAAVLLLAAVPVNRTKE